MGCPGRCVFCAQNLQTGQRQAVAERVLAHLRDVLRSLPEDGAPCDIAFYGGAFTLWPPALQLDCLRVIRQRCGASVFARCSTRPDALDHAWLEQLHGHGMRLIELGVQSFDDAALSAAERGYAGSAAVEGCRRVRAAGLACGVQLMPGMPGVDPDVFLRDVAVALAEGAACLRFYPCLVLEGTRLADWWREGRFTPWDMDTTVRVLGRALAMAWAAQTPVIRMGLAPGRELEAAVLAGPWHPSLGSLVQAEAMAVTVESLAAGFRPVALRLPAACRGFMGGRDKPIWERLSRIGLFRDAVLWHDDRRGELVFQ
jgi:histone acetyltransferase (RNA polymerase elongator complex component)